MCWTRLHTTIIGKALENILGKGDSGSVAFLRCLTPEIVSHLAADKNFCIAGWEVWRIGEVENRINRTISADCAVELREIKKNPVFLLVDTSEAGAGMDGIYSSAREISEKILFKEAIKLVHSELDDKLSVKYRKYAEKAVKKARGHGGLFNISTWNEFDFFVQIASSKELPGTKLYLIGLWPVLQSDDVADGELDVSKLFVERLLGPLSSGSPEKKIQTLRLLKPSEKQLTDLGAFLWSAATKLVLAALKDLKEKPDLWINSLCVESSVQDIQSIEITPWRKAGKGKIENWSGLVEEYDYSEGLPVFVINPDAANKKEYSSLEVRWKVRPENLKKSAVEYKVAIVTDMDGEICDKKIIHSARKEEKCRFDNDDFNFDEKTMISAKVVISVIGNDSVENQETEEFMIRVGLPENKSGSVAGLGDKVRTLSEGLIELEERSSVSEIASSEDLTILDSKGFLVLRSSQQKKSFRVFQPSLIREVEEQWVEKGGAIGRWRVKIRSTGVRTGAAEFIELDCPKMIAEENWKRLVIASRKMAERFSRSGGSIGQIYDEKSKHYEYVIKEYLIAWSAAIEKGCPSLSLANTVEVQSLSGKTIGLIVLPSHPLRLCWHVAYDNLVLCAAFDKGLSPKEIREEFKVFDGSMFPSVLPGLEKNSSFVFGDTLGFHAVGMVLDSDKEPKAALALLSRALGEPESVDIAPTVGRKSAEIIGGELCKYIECHTKSSLFHVHALRPGDGFTILRSLGFVYKNSSNIKLNEEDAEDENNCTSAFVLELYPSEEQKGVAGRFIGENQEKRRSGAGVISDEDKWMMESINLFGGINIPRLRWAKKSRFNPETPAHVAVAFDTFESRVVCELLDQTLKNRPFYAYGMMNFFERKYKSSPSPQWRSFVLSSSDGEKHPSSRTHTDYLSKIQQGIIKCVSNNLDMDDGCLSLLTEISDDRAVQLKSLHNLCDWVITVDRNAGIEYFDSPSDNKDIYDAYVIDCVPEREDLGCLQLITTTSNMDEVRRLLDSSLDQMGLSRSLRNAQFLLEHLKALSGRLAIRLTGQKAPTSELIALSMSHASCFNTLGSDECWTPLSSGFFIPIDDIQDLLPPLKEVEKKKGNNDKQDDNEEKAVRPDLMYVSILPRKGLIIRFIEVKYRRHLRATRNPFELKKIQKQTESLRKRWTEWYSDEEKYSIFKTIRLAKLARVFRFYADKASRHGLSGEEYKKIIAEIDRMVEKGSAYSFCEEPRLDRGWIFCPEYAGSKPQKISPEGWDTVIFVFGPSYLPDFDFRNALIGRKTDFETDSQIASFSPKNESNDLKFEDGLDSVNIPSEGLTCEATKPPQISFGESLSGDKVSLELKVQGNPHLLIAGLPGMGKTTCLINMCTQMLKSGVVPILFSYHQDIDEKLEKIVGSIRYVDFDGLNFNPLQVTERTNKSAHLDVAGTLRDIFIAIFPELGDIQGEQIRKAVKDSFVEQGWDDSNVDFGHLEEPNFKRFVEILRDTPKPDRGLKTLLARLDELEDYGFFDLSSKTESLWDAKIPVVIRIHKTPNENLQRAFSSLILYGLYKDMFRRGTKDNITHAVIFDEAHRAAGLGLIPTMAKECRKYGISMILASQEAKDFNVSLFSAIANYLVLKLSEIDAKALVRNVSNSKQERLLIDKLKQMDKFKALYFSEGQSRPVQVSLSEA